MIRRAVVISLIASLAAVAFFGYGCDDLVTENNTIIIFDYPEARFSASPTEGCTGEQVRFVDQSTPTNGLTLWTWSFGDSDSASVVPLGVGEYEVSYTDGTTDTLSSPGPRHVYDSAGIYEVTLTIVDTAQREDTEIKPNLILVGGPKAEFTTNSGDTTMYLCPGEIVEFVNRSRGGINENQWVFTNLDSNTEDVSFRYQPDKEFLIPGVYRVTLFTEGNCTPADSFVIDSLVVIGDCVFLDIQLEGGNGLDTTICQNESVTLNFTLTGGPLDSLDSLIVFWGDGDDDARLTIDPVTHTYLESGGPFDIIARAYTSDQFITEARLDNSVLVRQLAEATITASPDSGDAPLAVQFNGPFNMSSYDWDFGDGVGTATIRNPSYTFDTAGRYGVRLIVDNECSIPDTTTDSVIVTNPGL